ncbi:MAG: dihydrodipicolinate synthase family protein [Tropicimonas sp.]|uniref:dihydrodipicolinate synthase family protein n=1 Tax=Tropicimonas sp. TaxID=2067044 RepID=UPI003A8AA550
MRANTDLKGVVAAVVTPLDAQFDIRAELLAHHCREMLAAGCSFTSPFGTTGEGASLSTAQKLAALDALMTAGLDPARLIPGTICSSLDDAAQMLSGIAARGCRAALVMPPFYYDLSGHDGVAQYYEALLERAGRPEIDIILYNFPKYSGVTFTPDLVRAVQARTGDAVAGIKDSTGDLTAGLALIEAHPDLSVFTGDDRILARMVAGGGAGIIGGIPNLFPKACIALTTGPVTPAAQALAEDRITAIDGNGGLAAIKALLADRYGEPAFARMVPPLLPLPAEAARALAGKLAQGAGN